MKAMMNKWMTGLMMLAGTCITSAMETPSLVVTTLSDVMNSDDGLISLREAIGYSKADAALGKTITFNENLVGGTIVLALGEVIITDGVTITGPGRNLLTINANRLSRVFNISGDDASVEISGLKITGGKLAYSTRRWNPDGSTESRGGGGIYNSCWRLTLSDVEISGNSISSTEYATFSSNGGGIYNERGTLILDNSAIIGNTLSCNPTQHYTASTWGGGIYSSGEMVSLTDTVVSNNTSSSYCYGFGLAYDYGSFGGGIYCYGSGSMVLINAEVNGNIVSAGMGNYNWPFPDRSAASGGGIYNLGTGHFTLENTKVNGNSAKTCSGIQSGGDIITLINVEVTKNTASQKVGYCVNLGGGVASITHSSIAGNADGGLNVSAGTSLRNTIVALNEGGTQANGDYTGSHNLIGIDPSFVNAGNGDLRLTAVSYAVNRGANLLAVDADGNPLITDVSGMPRIVGSSVDIGAHEYQGDALGQEAPSGIVTTLLDICNPTDGLISLREAIAYAAIVESINTITFDTAMDNGTITLTGGEIVIHSSLGINASALSSLTIDAAKHSRVFSVVGSNVNVWMTGLTITGGSSDIGGGIYIYSGNVTLTDVIVEGNSVTNIGGGIYINSGNVTLTDVMIKSNSAAGHGGGIYINSGNVTLMDAMVEGNSTPNNGGGVYCNSGSLSLTGVVISKNVSQGVYLGGAAIVTRSMICNNIGHGVYILPAGSAVLVNTKVTENGACGMYVSGTAMVTHATISKNTSSGMNIQPGGSAMLANTIVALNGTVDVAGAYTNEHSLIAVDPLFAYSADGVHYRLTANSPAVNRGDILSAVDADGHPLATDIEGRARINGSSVDAGAYEYVPLRSLSISGPASVAERSRGLYECSVVYEDGFTSAVTPTWSLNVTVAQISVGGLLTVNYVTNQMARISAQYDSAVAGKDVLFVDSGNLPVSLNLIGSAVAEQQMTIQYSLMATYEDGSIVDVTGQAEWHGGSNNATMNNGLLTTMDLPCDVQTFLSATFLDLHAEKAIVLATPRKTYVVDTLTDTLDGTDGKTSLREALSAANSNTSVYGLFAGSGVFVDMIVFDGNLAGGTCNLSRGQLTITDSVTIIGLGTDELTIDANHTSRVLDISGSNVVANISSLTISGGEVGLGWGGGISNNSKKLTLMNAKVIGNHSNNFYGKGGGIYNDSGVLELLNTVVSGNSCSSGGGYYATAFGGGIYINNGMMALINSVVSGNFVSGAPNMHGGGIFNSGAASIVNTTVTGNLSSGGIFSSGALIIQNTIIALNMDYDMSGTYTGSNNIVGRDPLFVDSVNGDYRLKKGSTAIDAGNNNFALNAAGNQLELDLGGNPRIAGALVDIGPLVDIGAYEYIKRPDVSIGSSDVRILNHLGIASDKPVIDELMQVEVTVHNIGETATVNDLLVQLFQDNAPQDISHYDVNSFNLAATGVISNRIPAGGSATILIPWLATGPARVLALWPVVEFADNRVQSQAGRSLPIDELSLDNNNTWRTVLIGSAGIGGFALWAYERGLPSNPAVASGGDGIANIYKYAFGNNLQAGDPLMKVKFANGVRVVEFPAQDMATLPYVNINVRASTNLINWTLALIPASNTTGKPANRNWFVPSGNPKKAFFSLGANLVTQP